jgi:hypothetical protein
MIVVFVAVAPLPILSLFRLASAFKILVLAMRLVFPPLVINHFVVVPIVVVMIVGIVIPVFRTAGNYGERTEECSQKPQTDVSAQVNTSSFC